MEAVQDSCVYVMKERVKIVKEVRDDYLIEDLETGKQYLVDKHYFHRKYVTENELIPVHQEVWDKLHNQALQLHQLKRANSRLKDSERALRKDNEAIRKQYGLPKQHYRNGRKRGRKHNGNPATFRS